MDRLAYTLEDQRLMSRAKNYFDWQGRLIMPELGRRVLEVGCGTGNFTRMLLDREAVIAIDIEAACVERVREIYPGRSNLCTFICGPERPDFAELGRFKLDSCVCLNVMEHIADDVTALRNIASVIAPRGSIVLLVPAFPALYGPIDRNLSHYRRYTAASLKRLAASAELGVHKLRYVNLPGFFGWWTNARLLRRESQSAAQITAFDRYIVPVASRIEAVVPPPFGQSLLAVLRGR